MGQWRSQVAPRAQGSAIEKTRAFRQNDVKNKPKMQMSEFIDGAVVKKSDVTLVKHVLFDKPLSKTRRKIRILRDKLLKTRRKMTPLKGKLLKARPKIRILRGKL